MLKQLLKASAVFSIVLLFLLFMAPAPAQAADLRQGDTVVIASGDVINDDLYVVASLLVIDGTVNGDVLWAGQTINVNGTVNGSLTALGMNVNIDGVVSRSVRTAGGTINIRGSIGGDLMVAGSTVDLNNKGTIGRDLGFAAGKISVDSVIGRSIKGNSNEATLSDGVGSNVEITSSKLTIASSARIQGDLIYTGKDAATIQNGAVIAGVTTHKIPQTRPTPWPPLGVWGSIIAFFMALITGIVVIVIAPKRAKLVAAAIKSKPLPALGWGALIFFVTPIAAVIVCITVIGLPVGLIGLLLYAIALYISLVVVSLFIGSWILGRSSKIETRGVMIGAFALGLFILTLINLIPYVGIPMFLATAIFGLGAMFVSEKTLRTSGPAALSPGQPVANA